MLSTYMVASFQGSLLEEQKEYDQFSYRGVPDTEPCDGGVPDFRDLSPCDSDLGRPESKEAEAQKS